MKLPDLKPGKYVVAVSGGVDSIVLLNLLSKLSGIELVIAHFNHGVREDSDADEELVLLVAKKYGLPAEVGYAQLGKAASEEAARDARYKFLRLAKEKHKAKAIVTAHHQDDLIETALINVLRGTGPQGLVAILSNPEVVRPLLHVNKSDIYQYAQNNNLVWREDATNVKDDYLRNYIRHNLASKLTSEQKSQLLKNIQRIASSKKLKDTLLAELSDAIYKDGKINRSKFAALPSEVASELLVYWLRQFGVRDFDKKIINRVNVLLRTAQAGTRHNIKSGLSLVVSKLTAQFARSD